MSLMKNYVFWSGYKDSETYHIKLTYIVTMDQESFMYYPTSHHLLGILRMESQVEDGASCQQPRIYIILGALYFTVFLPASSHPYLTAVSKFKVSRSHGVGFPASLCISGIIWSGSCFTFTLLSGYSQSLNPSNILKHTYHFKNIQ